MPPPLELRPPPPPPLLPPPNPERLLPELPELPELRLLLPDFWLLPDFFDEEEEDDRLLPPPELLLELLRSWSTEATSEAFAFSS